MRPMIAAGREINKVGGISRSRPSLLLWLLVPILPLWAGCVIYEESEERIQIDGEQSIARHTVTEFNIESGESTAQGHWLDFRGVIGVIEEWNGDGFLVSAAEGRNYVLSRRL